MKFIKKPIAVEAVQFYPGIGDYSGKYPMVHEYCHQYYIKTNSGDSLV